MAAANQRHRLDIQLVHDRSGGVFHACRRLRDRGMVQPARNGAAIPGSTYGSGSGTQQNDGHVIVTLAAGDVLTLVNSGSGTAVTLQTLAGGTQTNVNASMTIEQVG